MVLFYSILCTGDGSALLPLVCPPLSIGSSGAVVFQTPPEKGCARQFPTKRAPRAFEPNRNEQNQPAFQPAKLGDRSILFPNKTVHARSFLQCWKCFGSAGDRSRMGTYRDGRKKRKAKIQLKKGKRCGFDAFLHLDIFSRYFRSPLPTAPSEVGMVPKAQLLLHFISHGNKYIKICCLSRCRACEHVARCSGHGERKTEAMLR